MGTSKGGSVVKDCAALLQESRSSILDESYLVLER